jgi:hypothetical protein
VRNAYKILFGEPKEKRPVGSPGRRCEDDINMDLRKIGMVWSGLIWLRIGNGRGLL